jgi:tRNA threonylcarbamoyladenosine biosynthesis protein TsaE
VGRTPAPEETQRLARRLGELCRAGDVLALSGDLGAGKTCFVQGLARGLEVAENEVVSPTFTLIQHHPGRVALDHIDLYRLGTEEELSELGLRDGEILGGEGVAAVEWAERFPDLFEDALWIYLAEGGPGERVIEASAKGERAEALLDAWTRDISPDIDPDIDPDTDPDTERTA